jgi:hypothetical protein
MSVQEIIDAWDAGERMSIYKKLESLLAGEHPPSDQEVELAYVELVLRRNDVASYVVYPRVASPTLLSRIIRERPHGTKNLADHLLTCPAVDKVSVEERIALVRWITRPDWIPFYNISAIGSNKLRDFIVGGGLPLDVIYPLETEITKECTHRYGPACLLQEWILSLPDPDERRRAAFSVYRDECIIGQAEHDEKLRLAAEAQARAQEERAKYDYSSWRGRGRTAWDDSW